MLAWLPGQEGAGAVADVLAGAVNPGGKLPISYPRSVGQLPVFYGHKISGGRSHWKGDYVFGMERSVGFHVDAHYRRHRFEEPYHLQTRPKGWFCVYLRYSTP